VHITQFLLELTAYMDGWGKKKKKSESGSLEGQNLSIGSLGGHLKKWW
jgi:hypothetical protein